MEIKQCEFKVYGRGRCGENIAPDRTHCATHRKEKCTECGRQADYDCSRYIRTWVCGASVCNECKDKHETKQHKKDVKKKEYTKLDIAYISYSEDGGTYPLEQYVDKEDVKQFEKLIREMEE